MSTVVLVQTAPSDPATGQPVLFRLAGGGTRAYTQLGVNDWRSGVASVPRFTSSIGFDQNGFTGGALPQTGSVRIFPSDKALMSSLAGMFWTGADISIAIGDDEAVAPVYSTVFRGKVADARASGGAITLTLSDLSADLDKRVCPDTFAGTGDLEGGEDATGRVKRRTWGYAFNIEGFLLDKANSIYEFGDPLRPFGGFALVKDKGLGASSVVTIAWQGTALATLNALRASAVPAGGAAVAPSIACVKWWTTPAGPLTADVFGETYNPADTTAATTATTIVGTYSTSIVVANRGEAVAWQPGVVGVHAADGTETVANLLDRLLLPVSIVWLLGGDGVLSFRRLAWGDPVEALVADTIDRETLFQPLKSRKLGFQRNHRIHGDSEISATLLLSTDVTYADGTPIEALKPAAKGADVTSANIASGIYGQAAAATDVTIETGATRDLARTGRENLNDPPSYYFDNFNGKTLVEAKFASALGITGYVNNSGTLTTIASASGARQTFAEYSTGRMWTRSHTDRAVWSAWAIAYNEDRKPYFGADLLESAGGLLATIGAFKTALGIASGFDGQGALATLSSLANGGAYLTGFGLLSQRSYIKIGGPAVGSDSFALLTAEGGSTSNTTIVTAQGVSSGIAGQGALATQSAARFVDQIFGLPYGINAFDGNGRLLSERMVYEGVGTVQAFRPQEPGANVTENRTASSIAGQGAFATRSNIASDADLAGVLANRLQGFPSDINYLVAYRVAWAGGDTVQNYKPQEAGANITENRVSSAFSGQGAFATLSTVTGANVASYFAFSAFRLDYSITRSDGVSTVTEALAITALGIASAVSGQGALATLNQADTTQIAPNAVSNFDFATIGIVSTAQGEQNDSDQTLTFTTTGRRLRVEISVDTVRAGTGTNIGYLQIYAIRQSDGAFFALGRQVKALAVADGPPVYYVTFTSLGAGTFSFGLRLNVGTGKGSNTWAIPTGTISVEETKR